MRRKSQVRIRQVLAAIVLLGSLSPPAYQHSHAGGQGPHQHSGHDFHSHHDDHAIATPHSHGPLLVATPAAHAHWTFLFFSVTLPVGDESDNRTLPVEVFDHAVILARSAGLDSVSTFAADVRAQIGAPHHWILHWTQRGTAHGIPPFFLSLPNRLCDTARHERSGVQLI